MTEQPPPSPTESSPVATELESSNASGQNGNALNSKQPLSLQLPDNPRTLVAIVAVSLLLIGWFTAIPWVGIPAALVTLFLCLQVIWQPARQWLGTYLSLQQQWVFLAMVTALMAVVGLISLSSKNSQAFEQTNWDAVGALAEAFGAAGQILVALLAAYVAWRQYVISRDLTMQQNRITQQQTIDSYFQGVADLILNEEGLLEDWPPERAIAEGRTAAILGGLDAEGKAKVLRFLSSAKLLTPLKRDRLLGRAIFDGLGGYEEDIEFGVRVIDLLGMLVGADLSGTDLRWTELSEADLSDIRLRQCDLSRANLSRAILQRADLRGANLSRARFFYGSAENATPRDRLNPPDYKTGAQTGAVVEDADFSNVKELSEEQRYYCCAWGGYRTRATIPGGCAGIPNRLESSSRELF